MTTMVKYLTALSSKQQEFIVWCAQRYFREDFHRGLLPFLEVDEAYNCLVKRIREEMGSTVVNSAVEPVQHYRFIKGIIGHIVLDTSDRMRYIQPFEATPPIKSDVAKLCTYRLRRTYKQWRTTYFTFDARHVSLAVATSILEHKFPIIVTMEQVGKNRWQVTADERFLQAIMGYLVRHFGQIKYARK